MFKIFCFNIKQTLTDHVHDTDSWTNTNNQIKDDLQELVPEKWKKTLTSAKFRHLQI